MIHDIFIALKKGILLFHKAYVDEEGREFDSDLVSSFLTAIISFAAELGENAVETMTFKNLKFVYGMFGKLSVIFLNDKEDNEENIKKKIKRVGEAFLLKYHELLPKWKGNVSTFSDFEIDSVIKSTVKIVFMGPGGVGKTTLCRLIKGDMIPIDHIPTIGVNISDMAFSEELGIVCWDLAGQEKFRNTWINFSEDADIILLICDSTEESLIEIKEIYQKFKFLERREVRFFVIANKQDLPNRLTPEYIESLMNLETYGFVAILPENREKIHRLLKMKIGEKIGETFTKIKQKISQKNETLFYLRNLKTQLSKLIDVSDPIFNSINLWMDKLKYYSKDELSTEDLGIFELAMMEWNERILLILERYYADTEKQNSCPYCNFKLNKKALNNIKECPNCKNVLIKCYICNTFIQNEKILECGFCQIRAHEEHFRKWLEYSDTCPNCSKKITISDLKPL